MARIIEPEYEPLVAQVIVNLGQAGKLEGGPFDEATTERVEAAYDEWLERRRK